jgi:hypothetical protein
MIWVLLVWQCNVCSLRPTCAHCPFGDWLGVTGRAINKEEEDDEEKEEDGGAGKLTYAMGETVYSVPGISPKRMHTAVAAPAPALSEHRREKSSAFWTSARGDTFQQKRNTTT